MILFVLDVDPGDGEEESGNLVGFIVDVDKSDEEKKSKAESEMI